MRAAGFTLIELIVTTAILAILSVITALFVVRPLEGYFDSRRRAELTDVADTALRRFGRDVRLALPNSVRVATNAGGTYIEMLTMKTGGRYRAAPDDSVGTAEDFLDFTAADSSFDTLGPMSAVAGQVVAAGDLVVVHNLGIAGASAYLGNNRSAVTGFVAGGGAIAGEDRIGIDPFLFPVESPGRRFQVVSGPTTFECLPGPVDGEGNGTGVLRRVSHYDIQAAQPTGTYAGTPQSALLAQYVSACTIDYTDLPLQARGLAAIRLTLTRGNEAVSLYYEAQVRNVP